MVVGGGGDDGDGRGRRTARLGWGWWCCVGWRKGVGWVGRAELEMGMVFCFTSKVKMPRTGLKRCSCLHQICTSNLADEFDDTLLNVPLLHLSRSPVQHVKGADGAGVEYPNQGDDWL